MLMLRIHTFSYTMPLPSRSFDFVTPARYSAQDDKGHRGILRLAALAQDDIPAVHASISACTFARTAAASASAASAEGAFALT